MLSNNIYTYWEGQEPDYIKMCYESLTKYCSENFKISRYSDYQNPIKFNSINHKTDWLKANLIYENGGFWIDADMIVMKDLSPLIKLVEKNGFAGIPGFFGAKKGNKVLGNWIDGMRDIITKQDTKIGHSDMIKPLLQHKRFKEFDIFTREMICPIYHTGDEFGNFFKDLPLDKFVTNNTYIVTLYNSAFNKDFKNMSREDILTSPWLISKMFKKVLE